METPTLSGPTGDGGRDGEENTGISPHFTLQEKPPVGPTHCPTYRNT